VAAEKSLADNEQLQRRRVVASSSPAAQLSLAVNNTTTTRIVHISIMSQGSKTTEAATITE